MHPLCPPFEHLLSSNYLFPDMGLFFLMTKPLYILEFYVMDRFVLLLTTLEQFHACLHRKYGPSLAMKSILGEPSSEVRFNIFPILFFLRSLNLLHQV